LYSVIHLPRFSSVYILKAMPHCRSLAWQAAAPALRLAPCRQGRRIPINTVITVITTSSSMRVKAVLDCPCELMGKYENPRKR
jgi:hypothetical protein